jgi:outer membrane protein TolC
VTWSNYLEGGFRHPLLRGGGIEFNRIAGPGSSPGLYGGVAVARINTDMSLNDFEMATRALVADVEKAYWNLYYAYHRLESVRAGREAAHQTWYQTKTYHDVGSRKGHAYMLAQAEQNYFSFRQQTELAQNNLFKAETAMRYILGLAASDGRLIRPVDDPITAPITLDWHSIVCEALFRSPELRKQKWAVKQRELELCASKNFLLPRLDLEANYRVAGAGKDLLGSDYSAYGSLAGGNYTGWTLGFTAAAPLGWRQEIAAARNAQLNLAKARHILTEQEVELTHQLAASFQEISAAYQQMQTTLATHRAASEEVRAVRNAYELDTTTLDQLLQAQKRQSDAETGYYSSVIDYNLAIMTLHYRKGSLLEYNNVCLSEGPWPSKAYFDAKRRARERDSGHYFNYGYTLPGVVSRGTYKQYQHSYDSMSYDALPTMQPNGESDYLIPSFPPAPEESSKMIETEATLVIPTPVLPKPDGNAAVSFTTPDMATPGSTTLTPSRNMRYVR